MKIGQDFAVVFALVFLSMSIVAGMLVIADSIFGQRWKAARQEYTDTCIKHGGTPVHNGKHMECFK